MLMAILFSSLVGAVLGTRFKVQVLLPGVPLAFMTAAGIIGITQAVIAPALLAGVLAAIALQIGYLGGLFTRWSVAAARISPNPRYVQPAPHRADTHLG
jgi:hypothetical protein